MKIVIQKKTILLFLLIISISSCLKKEELNLEFESCVPTDIGDGLIITTPEAENIDPNVLTDIYSYVYTNEDFWSLRSLLIFRNGNLVAESYLKDKQDIINRHLIWSCTKQVMGILTGIAIDKGYIININDPISDYFDSELVNHEDKASISILNLLTMQSGIDYDNDGINGETDKLLRQIPDNSIDFILSRPINAEQGKVFHYNDGNPHLISAIIQKITGKYTDIWANEVLFSKIELTNYNWTRYKDGITLGGFGIETTPREIAKIALCVANHGRWKGEKIIDSVWLSQMINPYVENAYKDYSFGLFWWIDKSRNIYFMDGHGGQYAFIVPDKQLLVIMTSFPNTQGKYQTQTNRALEIVDRIMNAAN
jgi:CubicO group peptidase (beta-lactamase class C family)